jgi:hypothetical protein
MESVERQRHQDGEVSADDQTGNFHGRQFTPAIVSEL